MLILPFDISTVRIKNQFLTIVSIESLYYNLSVLFYNSMVLLLSVNEVKLFTKLIFGHNNHKTSSREFTTLYELCDT